MMASQAALARCEDGTHPPYLSAGKLGRVLDQPLHRNSGDLAGRTRRLSPNRLTGSQESYLAPPTTSDAHSVPRRTANGGTLTRLW